MQVIIILVLVLLLNVLFNQVSRLYFKNSKNSAAATILAELVSGFFALFCAPLYGFNLNMPLVLWGLFVLACVFYALNNRFETEVRKNLETSTYIIIGQSSTVFIILLSLIFFAQIPTWGQIIGVLLIILGQVILNYQTGKFQVNKWFLIALLSNLMFALAIIIDIGIADQINLPIYVALTFFVPAIMIFFIEKVTFRDLRLEYIHNNKRYLLLTGFGWGTFVVAILTAYQLTNVINVVAVTACAVIINVLLGILLLKENTNLVRKIIASVCVAIGVIITVLVIT